MMLAVQGYTPGSHIAPLGKVPVQPWSPEDAIWPDQTACPVRLKMSTSAVTPSGIDHCHSSFNASPSGVKALGMNTPPIRFLQVSAERLVPFKCELREVRSNVKWSTKRSRPCPLSPFLPCARTVHFQKPKCEMAKGFLCSKHKRHFAPFLVVKGLLDGELGGQQQSLIPHLGWRCH